MIGRQHIYIYICIVNDMFCSVFWNRGKHANEPFIYRPDKEKHLSRIGNIYHHQRRRWISPSKYLMHPTKVSRCAIKHDTSRPTKKTSPHAINFEKVKKSINTNKNII